MQTIGRIVLCLVLLVILGAAPPTTSTGKPAERPLQGEDAKRAAKLEEYLDQHRMAHRWAEAARTAEALAALRADRQGRDHWQAVNADWQSLAQRLHAQRLAPLSKHLAGVKQLIVLPSAAMDGIPLEAIAQGYTISYASSASMSVQLRRGKPETQAMLALGDANFQRPDAARLPLPAGGILLTVVPPGSPAAVSGLRSGDVLLTYGDRALNTLADLHQASSEAMGKVQVRVWRLPTGAGKATELTLQVPPGRLGVLVALEPAPKALNLQRHNDQVLQGRDASNWQPLPGTRYEVSALKHLFAGQKATVLLDSEASETKLDELAKEGVLSRALPPPGDPRRSASGQTPGLADHPVA